MKPPIVDLKKEKEKNMKCVKSIFCTAIVMMAAEMFAAPYVTNVVAKQRYPWGIVDISCEVKGVEEKDKGLEFTIDAVSSNSGITNKVSHVHFRGGETSGLEVTTNGNYQFVWDANKDIGSGHNNNMIIRVSIFQDKVQLWENGPYWATRNIGANEPWESGYYFWWGDTIGYKRENDKWVASDGSNSNFSFQLSNTLTNGKNISSLQSEGWIISKNDTYVFAPKHDAAQVQLGGEWRMPTNQEFDDLVNNCDWLWTTMNGVTGYRVRGRGDYASASIFLPCAGYGKGPSLNYAGSCGDYWSSVPGSVTGYSWNLSFSSGRHITNGYSRDIGLSVRPLQGFTR